jgi:hypothetical protein
MNRHDTDTVSLVFGILFAAFVGWWLLVRWVSITAPGPGWFLAVSLVALGVAGIVANVGWWRRDRIDPPRDSGLRT